MCTPLMILSLDQGKIYGNRHPLTRDDANNVGEVDYAGRNTQVGRRRTTGLIGFLATLVLIAVARRTM